MSGDKIDQYVRAVAEAEQSTGVDPTLEKVVNWAEVLTAWESLAREIANASGADVHQPPETPSKLPNQQLAGLLVRLVHTIEPALSARGRWKELTELAIAAYRAATALQNHNSAARMAGVAAEKLYLLGRSGEAEAWVNRMTDQLRHINPETENSALRLKQLELKGLLLRDYRGEREAARFQLQEGLTLATNSSSAIAIARLLAHLGKLEELEGHADKAIELYKRALESATEQQNVDLRLDCLDKLSRLALGQARYDDAHTLYSQQLRLADESLRPFYLGRAHEGLAWILWKQQNYHEAYSHARQALAIEERITGTRVNALHNLVIMIADAAMNLSR
jgi:tetratricopeptide (TPR) repeat protein